MNHPTAHRQVPHPSQMPQNVGQQRPTPIGQPQQTQVRPQIQTQSPSFNPQLALFVLEKGKAKHWDDVEAQTQHIPMQDLRDALSKTRRKKISVKTSLEEIKSATIRRLINELVELETKELWEHNRTLQWKIASVDIEWNKIRGGKEIKRVSVLLETEPSGFPKPRTIKPQVAAGVQGMQDPNKVKQNPMGNGQQGPMNNQAVDMAQQKHMQQQHTQQMAQQHAQHQQFDQQQRAQGGNQAPPPPPPPPGHQAHGASNPPPPPPPPGHGGGGQPRIIFPNGIPGAHPGSPHGSKHGGPPQIQVLNERFLRHDRPRAGHHTESSPSDDDGNWSTESGSTGSARIRGHKHEHDERKSRGRSDKHDRSKTSKNRSRSASRVGTRSKLRTSKHKTRARSISSNRLRSSRRNRHSDAEDYLSDNKYHSSSSSSGSSRSGRHGKHRRRRSSRDLSPLSVHIDSKRTSKKHNKHHRMSHEGSEASWHGSDTSSARTSSAAPSSTYAPGDRIWDDRVRTSTHRHKHPYPRDIHTGHTSPSSFYDDYKRRPDMTAYPDSSRYDDYPYQPILPRRRDSYFTDDELTSRPPLQRFSTAQTHPTHANSPFTTAYATESPRYAPSLRRASTAYSPDTYAQARYVERPVEPGALDMIDLKEAVLEVLQEKQRGGATLGRRYAQQQGAGARYVGEDEWDVRAGRGYGGGYGGGRGQV